MIIVVPVVCVLDCVARSVGVFLGVCVLALVMPVCEYFVENWAFGNGVLVGLSHRLLRFYM